MKNGLPKNLSQAIEEAEFFTNKVRGKSFPISEMFQLPDTLPWNVFAIFMPPRVTNLSCVRMMQMAGRGLRVWEEIDVDHFTFLFSDKPRLYLIERSERPTKSTMGLSPDQLLATKSTFTELGRYAIAMGMYHELTGKYLDSEETFTWFPRERRPQNGGVASGHWNLSSRKVRFHKSDSDLEFSYGGARLEIPVPLKLHA